MTPSLATSPQAVILSKAKNPRISLGPAQSCSSIANHAVVPSERSESKDLRLPCTAIKFLSALALLTTLAPAQPPHPHTTFSGAATYTLTQQFLQTAPKRYITSAGHARAEDFIRSHFAPEAAKGNVDLDNFTASTPAGSLPVHNIIVKFPSTNPAKRDGIIVLVSHYETNYPLRDINFVGANDGAATTALLIEIGDVLRAHPPDGYSVWLVFDDGEEAIQSWSDRDSLYGTKHLAARWSNDGTLAKIKAVLIADMIADRDLDILDETRSTEWLRDLLKKAAANTHHAAALASRRGAEEDDHTPFLQRGVPTIDIIDENYGPHTAANPDGWHHTADDTLDKISARSLQTSGDLFLEMIRLINQRS